MYLQSEEIFLDMFEDEYREMTVSSMSLNLYLWIRASAQQNLK